MAVKNLGVEEGMTLTVLADVPGITAGTVLPMLGLVGEGEPTHSEELLSEVPRHMGDVEDHHEETAGHSECSAGHRLLSVAVGEVHSTG